MSKTEHSPLPWIAGGWGGPIDCVYDANGDAVCEPSPQNADHIVTACNSYYENEAAIAELVEALGQLTAWKAPVEITAPELGGLLNAMYRANDLIAKHKVKP